jgi:hypothetical protein
LEFINDLLYRWAMDNLDADQEEKRKNCKRKNLHLPKLWLFMENIKEKGIVIFNNSLLLFEFEILFTT